MSPRSARPGDGARCRRPHRHADPALDQLIVNTLAGLDQVNVGAGVAGLIGVTVIQ